MSRAVNFSAGPDTLLPAELNSVQDDYDALAARMTLLHTCGADRSTGGNGLAGDWAADTPGVTLTQAITSNAFSPASITCFFYYDPSMYITVANARKPRMYLRSVFASTGTLTVQTWTLTVARVSTIGGVPPAFTVNLLNMAGAPHVSGAASDANGSVKTALLDTTATNWATGMYIVRFAATGTFTGTGAYAVRVGVYGLAS